MRDKPGRLELDQATKPLPKEAPLEAKLAHLRDALELSDRLDAIALRDIPEPNSELRFTTAIALRPVIGFLESLGFSSLTLRRLLKVLSELDEGHIHPLVTPPKIAHRKSDSVSVQSHKGMAAAAMHLLMDDAEETKDQAASKVANRLQKTPFHTYGGKPITAKMIASWRDQYIGFPSEANRYGAAIFQTVLIAARGKFLTPATRAAAVLQILASQAAKI